MDEHASAIDTAAAIRAKEVSPLEVLEATLARIDAREPRPQRRDLAQRRRGPGGGDGTR